MTQPLSFIIAGGKTGGHLFPGIAIAQALTRLEPESRILFVGTGESFETRTVERYGFEHQRIVSSGIKGKGIFQKLSALSQIPFSIYQSIAIHNQFKPDLVIGVGGYASGPVLLAARLCGIKTTIQEQNSMAGITNRILSRIVHTIFTAYPATKGFEHSNKQILTGNPIRQESLTSIQTQPSLSSQLTDAPLTRQSQSTNRNTKSDNNGKTDLGAVNHRVVDHETENDGIDRDSAFQDEIHSEEMKDFTILVTGGSQGARSINSAVVSAMELMSSDLNDSGEAISYHLIHQTGALDEDRIVETYGRLKEEGAISQSIQVTAQAFFNDMPKLMGKSDLIICRAGAGTLSELTVMGRPALLVPYPYAADDHQTFNAKALTEQHAAWMIPDDQLTGEAIKEKIHYAATHPEEMRQMAETSKTLGMPHADETIAEICIRMVRETETPTA